MRAKLVPTILLILALALGGSGCAAYMAVMGSLPMTGSVAAVNTMAVPICRVTVSLVSDPSVTYRNELSSSPRPYLLPGEPKRIGYPIKKDANGGPASTPEDRYVMEVFSCVNRSPYSLDAGPLLATIDNVDVRSGAQVVLR